MLNRVLLSLVLAQAALPALAGQSAPIFGSSTQNPVMIVVNPDTGLPVATAELPTPVVASAR